MHFRHGARLYACLLIGASICAPITAKADELPAIPVTPTQTKILLLPTLDQTGDRPEMQQEHVKVSNHRLEYEFLTRGFQMIGPDQALRAARAEDIDLDDSDSRGKNTLKTLAKDTGADWVVSLTVVEVRRENKSTLFFNSRRGVAKLFVKIYDMHQNGWIANRAFQDTKTTTRVAGSIGTTGLFKEAIDTTVQRSISNLLSPYPQTVKIADEFGEDDLLSGAAGTAAAPVNVAPATSKGPDTTAASSATPAQPTTSEGSTSK